MKKGPNKQSINQLIFTTGAWLGRQRAEGGGGQKVNIFMTSSCFPFLTCSVFKSARMHIYIGDIISLQQQLTFEEKSQFIHETLAPEMYKVIYVNSFLCSTWNSELPIIQNL